MALIYLVAFVIGLGEVLVDTASPAAIPQLVGDGSLEQANSRMVGAQLATGEIIRLPVGATLFALAAVAPFVVDAATFLAGAFLIATIRRPLQARRLRTPTRLVTEMRDGFAFLWRHEFLRRSALAIGLSNLAFSATSSLFVFVRHRRPGCPADRVRNPRGGRRTRRFARLARQPPHRRTVRTSGDPHRRRSDRRRRPGGDRSRRQRHRRMCVVLSSGESSSRTA